MPGPLESTRAYYHRRADEWDLGTGRFADYDRPRWDIELAAVIQALGGPEARRTRDPPAVRGFSPGTFPATSSGWTRARRW